MNLKILTGLYMVLMFAFPVSEAIFVNNVDGIGNFHAVHIPAVFPHSEEDPWHTISLSFRTHGVQIPLILTQHSSELLIGTSVTVVGENGIPYVQPINKKRIYEGHVAGHQGNSSAFLVLKKTGHVEGFIHFEGEKYIVEPVAKYIKESESSEMKITAQEKANHMVHRERDINMDIVHKHKCGDVPFEPLATDVQHNEEKAIIHRAAYETAQSRKSVSKRRYRRGFSSTRPSCSVQLVADETFFENIGGGVVEDTESILIQMLADVDSIFSSTTFGDITDVHVHVGNIIIWKAKNSTGNVVANSSEKDSLQFLKDFGAGQHAGYCLSHLFTFRDFEDSVLGKAFKGSPTTNGGICGRQSNMGPYRTNIGFSSFNSEGKNIGIGRGSLVFAHEIGHGFGAGHDPLGDPVCTPGAGGNGNYLMYFGISSFINLPNQRKFSPCSRAEIAFNLISSNADCFRIPNSQCGNGVIEYPEQCDCGKTYEECLLKDPCCDRTTCTLKPGVQCSPESGVCCNSQCKFESPETVCNAETNCLHSAKCNGTSVECPAQEFKNDTCINPAINLTGVCQSGTCLQPSCEVWNLTECLCEGEKQCVVCCSVDGQCLPSDEVMSYLSLSEVQTLYRPEGSFCDGGLSVCNGVGNCTLIPADDTVEGEDNPSWLSEYWWLLFVVAGAILLPFIVICAHAINEKRLKRKWSRRTKRVGFRMMPPETNLPAPPETAYIE
eukprot:Nk52_evm63s2192 gene=Nk52_evmTU63s2192